MKKCSRGVTFWKSQLPIDYLDQTLVQNTWENVTADLSEECPARLWFIIVEQTNNGATNEDIELEITINGTAYTVTISGAVSGTLYYIHCQRVLLAGDFRFIAVADSFSVGQDISTAHTKAFNAESVGLIRVRQTTDVDGTSAQIEVNIVWDKL